MKAETKRMIERGYGFWCYEAYVNVSVDTTATIPPVEPDAETAARPLTYQTKPVYRPVNVGVDDDGEPCAWYYGDYETPKVYVRMDEVRLLPPRRSEKAYKYE